MDELIARIEAASGPDRELDKAVQTAIDGFEHADHLSNKPFTGSVDAALTLVLDGMLWMVTNTGVDDPHKPDFSKATAVVADWRRSASEGGDRSAATPALALCAAALRARAA